MYTHLSESVGTLYSEKTRILPYAISRKDPMMIHRGRDVKPFLMASRMVRSSASLAKKCLNTIAVLLSNLEIIDECY